MCSLLTMNNIYGPPEVYTVHNDMCYEQHEMSDTDHSINSPLGIMNGEKQQTKIVDSKWYRSCPQLSIVLNVVVVFSGFQYAWECGYIKYAIDLGYICKDPTISHLYNGQQVNTIPFFLMTLSLGLVVITITELCRDGRHCYRGVLKFYKEYVIVGTLALLVTNIIKFNYTEHRPIFLHMCQPDKNPNCTIGEYVTNYTCTNKEVSDFVISTLFKSFPSGHATISSCNAVFLSYYVHLRFSKQYLGKLFKQLAIAGCISWCVVCSFSRVTDGMHHWWDVLAGLFIGSTVAFYNRQLFATETEMKNKLSNSDVHNSKMTQMLDSAA